MLDHGVNDTVMTECFQGTQKANKLVIAATLFGSKSLTASLPHWSLIL